MNYTFICKSDPFFWGKLFAFEEENKPLIWNLDLFGNGSEDLLVLNLSVDFDKMSTLLAVSQVYTDLG